MKARLLTILFAGFIAFTGFARAQEFETELKKICGYPASEFKFDYDYDTILNKVKNGDYDAMRSGKTTPEIYGAKKMCRFLWESSGIKDITKQQAEELAITVVERYGGYPTKTTDNSIKDLAEAFLSCDPEKIINDGFYKSTGRIWTVLLVDYFKTYEKDKYDSKIKNTIDEEQAARDLLASEFKKLMSYNVEIIIVKEEEVLPIQFLTLLNVKCLNIERLKLRKDEFGRVKNSDNSREANMEAYENCIETIKYEDYIETIKEDKVYVHELDRLFAGVYLNINQYFSRNVYVFTGEEGTYDGDVNKNGMKDSEEIKMIKEILNKLIK